MTHVHRFHPLEPSRAFLDLPSFSARGMTAADVDERMRAVVEACAVGGKGGAGGIDDRVVRLMVRDLPRHISRDLDHRMLRDYKRRALHFHLDVRRPDVVRVHGQGAPGRRPSLADIVRDKLQGRLLEGNIDRGALVDLGLRYLAEAETAGPSTAVMDSVGEH